MEKKLFMVHVHSELWQKVENHVLSLIVTSQQN